MNLPEMIVAIVALVVIGGVVRSRIAAFGHPSAAPAAIEDDNRRLADEVRHLRERVQVLERVITDNRSGTDLAHEIDALRDR